MKRQGNLWLQVVDFENLHRAAYAVMRGKRGNPEMGAFFMRLEENLFEIQRQLQSHTYEPRGYRTFWISEPKPRLISAASIRDRVIHHALVQAIEPVFEKRFIHHSYACRTGKGTHRAITQFGAWLRASPYVLKMDIRKFFPSIDHEILMRRISRFIKDRDVLWLCGQIISGSNPQEAISSYFPGDDLFAPFSRPRGLPIGNLTSQFFGNVYLDDLDHFVKERLGVRRYLRYVDDFCCFGDSKKDLQRTRAEISAYLCEIRLKLNEGKSRIRRPKEGVEFLGFVHSQHQSRLNQVAIKRQRRRMRQLRDSRHLGAVSHEEVATSLRAWRAHAAHGNCYRLTQKVLSSVNYLD